VFQWKTPYERRTHSEESPHHAEQQGAHRTVEVYAADLGRMSLDNLLEGFIESSLAGPGVPFTAKELLLNLVEPLPDHPLVVAGRKAHAFPGAAHQPPPNLVADVVAECRTRVSVEGEHDHLLTAFPQISDPPDGRGEFRMRLAGSLVGLVAKSLLELVEVPSIREGLVELRLEPLPLGLVLRSVLVVVLWMPAITTGVLERLIGRSAGGWLRGPPSPQPHMARSSVIQR
jgi:hypothetical protein